jgi:E3 ubiquitin-protein ligase HECTD1
LCKKFKIRNNSWNGKTKDWANPAQFGLVVVTSSEGKHLTYLELEDIYLVNVSAFLSHRRYEKSIVCD